MMSFNVPLPPDSRAFLLLLATILVTSVHHVYRLGPAFPPTALAALLVPLVLVTWYRHAGRTFILHILETYTFFRLPQPGRV